MKTSKNDKKRTIFLGDSKSMRANETDILTLSAESKAETDFCRNHNIINSETGQYQAENPTNRFDPD